MASNSWAGQAVVVAMLALEPALSRQETGKRARADLAQRLKIPVDQVRIVSEADVTWPDATLGCGDKRRIQEPEPVKGFRFTLEVDGRHYEYHADRVGRLRRCEPEKKPLNPIR